MVLICKPKQQTSVCPSRDLRGTDGLYRQVFIQNIYLIGLVTFIACHLFSLTVKFYLHICVCARVHIRAAQCQVRQINSSTSYYNFFCCLMLIDKNVSIFEPISLPTCRLRIHFNIVRKGRQCWKRLD